MAPITSGIFAVIRGGNIDYNELWKAIYAASSRKERDLNPGASWDRRADEYEICVRDDEGAVQEVGMMELRHTDTVLDMGAGTGRLAVVMAERVAHVTALDPSGGMLAHLRKNMRQAGLSNYSCVQARWEDVILNRDIMPHDVVVAAYSLGFYDLRAALEKLDAAAERAIYLFWHAGEWRSPEEMELWKAVLGPEGGSHMHYPDYQLITNILHEMGIFADVRIYRSRSITHYASPEEATQNWITLHRAPPESSGPVCEHFRRVLQPADDGTWTQVKPRMRAMISWKKGG